MELSGKLKQIRTTKNLSQKEVALSVGIDRGQYSRFENGKAEPSLATLHKLAKALDVNIQDFFSDDESYDINSYDKKLIEKVRMIDNLGEKQKELVYGFIDTILANQKMKNILQNAIEID